MLEKLTSSAVGGFVHLEIIAFWIGLLNYERVSVRLLTVPVNNKLTFQSTFSKNQWLEK